MKRFILLLALLFLACADNGVLEPTVADGFQFTGGEVTVTYNVTGGRNATICYYSGPDRPEACGVRMTGPTWSFQATMAPRELQRIQVGVTSFDGSPVPVSAEIVVNGFRVAYGESNLTVNLTYIFATTP